MQLDQQSRQDLEFDTICSILAGFCKSAKAKNLAANLRFFSDVQALQAEYDLLAEIQHIRFSHFYQICGA